MTTLIYTLCGFIAGIVFCIGFFKCAIYAAFRLKGREYVHESLDDVLDSYCEE